MTDLYRGDLRELVVEKWTVLTPTTPVYVYCPQHEDRHRPSMRVYPDGAHCFTCGAHLSRRAFSQLFSEEEHSAARLLAPTIRREYKKRSSVDVAAVALAGHKLLLANLEKREWLYKRGITDATIDRFLLGHYGAAYTLPVLDDDGEPVTIRFRRDDEEAPEAPKYWGLAGSNSTQLFPDWSLGMVAVMTEGEFDTLLLQQEGLPSFSLTNGCRSGEHLDQWVGRLANVQRLILCRDQDHPGREATDALCALLEQRFPALDTIHIVWESHLKDVSELWQYDPSLYRGTIERVRSFVHEAAAYAATA